MVRSLPLLFFSIAAGIAQAQYTPAVPKWNQPVAPVRIVGNLYYVGASGVSAFLLTTPQGHILIDSGFRETVPLIEANLAKLGFRFRDIRLILTSHAHYDHVAGIAEIKRRTGARFLANPVEAPQFARGGKGDFAFGDRYPFPPVTPNGPLEDGTPAGIGGVLLTPHFTPGHTKGCTSYTTTVREGGRDYHVLIACSISAPGYQLVGNAKYPEIVQDFERSMAVLRTLPCDVFLSMHGWDFDLERKLKERAAGARTNPFLDSEGRDRYIARSEKALRVEIERESEAR